MGNDSLCKTIGIGMVRIKMDDGTMRTLSNVQHVPDLNKKLISLGLHDANGNKYTVEGGVMTVSRGVLVLMKARMFENLYI